MFRRINLRRHITWRWNALMILGLLAPEIILAKACSDWMQCSGHLRRLIRQYPACGWTEAHAFFAYMGGFRLVNTDGSKRQLRETSFFNRVHYGEIDIPTVIAKYIHDKSKGDWITKAIVVVETLWFALQIMNRYAQQLPVTELETTALAHVTLNVFIYWCWWNKPVNVMLPIDIPAKRSARDITEQTSTCSREGSGEMVQRSEGEHSEKADKDRLLGDKEAQTTQPQLSIRVRMGAFLADVDGDETMDKVFPRVVALFSGIFGGVHCLAWYSTFHTHIESILWRSCALIVTVVPFVLYCSSRFLFTWLRFGTSASKMMNVIEDSFLALGVILYIIARVCLLVLAFLALKTVPEKALLIPSWTRYIPHI
ncbi:hypothetical protein APHAL10511_004053 [Amanita phalloides]|nr:hypothetical protein APHAL10511_004053 [Amanita phalloides]